MAIKLLGILAVLAGQVVSENRNFSDTCNSIELSANSLGVYDQLKASCGTDELDGSQARETTINLNLCLGIDHTSGELAWSVYGKFQLYCSDCSLCESTILSCTCQTLSQGVGNLTSIDLNDGIGNDDGVLRCMGGIGT